MDLLAFMMLIEATTMAKDCVGPLESGFPILWTVVTLRLQLRDEKWQLWHWERTTMCRMPCMTCSWYAAPLLEHGILIICNDGVSCNTAFLSSFRQIILFICMWQILTLQIEPRSLFALVSWKDLLQT